MIVPRSFVVTGVAKKKVRSSVKEIGSVESVIKKAKGEANAVRATPAWEKARVQISAGAIDAVGPQEIARPSETKEAEMSKRGIGYAAAKWSSIENYGEKKIVGYTDDGESVSVRVQRADVKKALHSVHKMNFGGLLLR